MTQCAGKVITVKPLLLTQLVHGKQFLGCQQRTLQFSTQQPIHANSCMISHTSLRCDSVFEQIASLGQIKSEN